MNKFNFMEVGEFYPTPDTLLDKITEGLNFNNIHTVLEPSAGKGNIVEYITKKADSYPYYNRRLDVDCIEIDETLRRTLKGKDMRVVFDDFLKYRTLKQYDLIIMNPPFSKGAAHLTHALELQKNGGSIICILNAETIRNLCTNERVALSNKLEELHADITFYKEEFVSAERTTNVEIAVVKVTVPEKSLDSEIFKRLETKEYRESRYKESNDVAPGDFVEAIVRRYEIEVEAGITLIREYYAIQPHIMNSINGKYANPMLELKCNGDSASINDYVKLVRNKYWSALFANPKFTGKMTSEQQSQYMKRVHELENYDFNMYNILEIKKEMQSNLVKGIEDCIISLFDELSAQYAWFDNSKNIHYFNGWCTNKSWIINEKVILPYMNAWSSWSNRYNPTDYHLLQKLADIEKALNYLDGGLSDGRDIAYVMENAELSEQTKNIRCKYFDITFYKKGTCHIVFRDKELLKKLNIFGSQQKGWLPQNYGRKKYKDMSAEEKSVIDEFEGETEYTKTLENADYYIYNPSDSLIKIA